MDIRDVKEEPKQIEDGKYLEDIYELQRFLIDHYVKIEGLPQYPIDVNTKPSQIILKDFTGRIVEELAEGYESHVLVSDIVDKYQSWDSISEGSLSQIINHLQNLNEELADAMHFFIELMIFANIQPEDIYKWLINHMKDSEISFDIDEVYNEAGEPDIIQLAMIYGRSLTIDQYSMDLGTGWKPLEHLSKFEDKEYIDKVKKYVPAGRVVDYTFILDCKANLWDIAQSLNISRNCLKNKPWKQSGVMTDETLYQSKLVEAFVYMMAYFSWLGLNSETVYYLYFKKNMINRFRIASNY